MAPDEPDPDAPPESRAAFSGESVEDAKRGHPEVRLDGLASRLGLEWLDRSTPAGYRAVVPGRPELQANVMRGVLPGGEYGVLAHEGLEIRWSGDSFDWGGSFHGVKVVARGVGLKGLLPFSGRVQEAQVRVPCTVSGARLPEVVARHAQIRIDTRRSAPPLAGGNRVKLDALLGFDGWSAWSQPALAQPEIEQILSPPVRELIARHAQDGLFQVAAWWGTLLVRRSGYLREDAELVELCEAASLLAGRLRSVCLAGAEPRPFTSELPPARRRDHRDEDAIFNLSQPWVDWAKETAARHGLTLEDPLEYHRAFPSVPVPGQAAVVLRGTLPGVGDCRLAVHRERDASRCALLVAQPDGLAQTPPGGLAVPQHEARLETGGGLAAVWGTKSYWGNAMAGDVDAFIAAAAATLAEAGAPG